MRILKVKATESFPAAELEIPIHYGEQKIQLNYFIGEGDKYQPCFEILDRTSSEQVATGYAQSRVIPIAKFKFFNPEETFRDEQTEENYALQVEEIMNNEFTDKSFTLTPVVYQDFLDNMKEAAYKQLQADRWEEEVGGYTINGMTISTDRESKSLLTSKVVKAMKFPESVCQWKFENGWIELTSDQVIEIGNAVDEFTQKCFDKEGFLKDLIVNLACENLEQYKDCVNKLKEDYTYKKYNYIGR